MNKFFGFLDWGFDFCTSRGEVFALFSGFAFTFFLAFLLFVIMITPFVFFCVDPRRQFMMIINAATACGLGTGIVNAFIFLDFVNLKSK